MISAGLVRTMTAGMVGLPSSLSESGGAETVLAPSASTDCGGSDPDIAVHGPMTSGPEYHASRPFKYQTLDAVSWTMKYGVLPTTFSPPSASLYLGSPSIMMSTVGAVT